MNGENKRMKKKPKTNRILGCLMAALFSVAGITGMAAGASAASPIQESVTFVQAAQKSIAAAIQTKGSITLDTAQYTMAPGDMYTIGAFLRMRMAKPWMPAKCEPWSMEEHWWLRTPELVPLWTWCSCLPGISE